MPSGDNARMTGHSRIAGKPSANTLPQRRNSMRTTLMILKTSSLQPRGEPLPGSRKTGPQLFKRFAISMMQQPISRELLQKMLSLRLCARNALVAELLFVSS